MGKYTRFVTFKDAGTYQATGAASAQTHTAIGVHGAKQILAVMTATRCAGTSNKLDAVFQTQFDNGIWYSLPTVGTGPYKFSFPQMTTIGYRKIQLRGPFGKTLRVKSTVGTWTRATFSILGAVDYED